MDGSVEMSRADVCALSNPAALRQRSTRVRMDAQRATAFTLGIAGSEGLPVADSGHTGP
jgi:hypothetical protein